MGKLYKTINGLYELKAMFPIGGIHQEGHGSG